MTNLDLLRRDNLELLSLLVTIFGFPFTIFSILDSHKNTRKSIDVQIIIALCIRFQEKWDADWGLLFDAGTRLSDAPSPSDRKNFYSILNWIDWVGVLIKHKALLDPRLMFTTIGINMKYAILLSHDILNEEGCGFWPGVFEVARRLGLVDSDGRISMKGEDFTKIKATMEKSSYEKSTAPASIP